MAYVNDVVFPIGDPVHSELDLILSANRRINHCPFWFTIEANLKKKVGWAHSRLLRSSYYRRRHKKIPKLYNR
jgi:hypothetical protein